jgi:Zn-dependent peptidase ImmA (M78 family)
MTAERQGQARAEEFRREHKLGHVPLTDLVSLIELTQKIDVAVLGAEPDEHGMTMRDPVRSVVMVAVAQTRNAMRQRSTLAHELAHVLFGDFAPPKASGWDARSHEEVRADAFARHLLVPLPGIEEVLARGQADDAESNRSVDAVSLRDLSVLVQRFKASPSLVAIQLCTAGAITDARKNDWRKLSTRTLASRFGWSDLYAGWQQEAETRRAPQRLLSRAIQGYVANTVSLQAIARLRGLPIEQIAAEFEAADIVPDPVEPVGPPPLAAERPDTDFSDLDALDAEGAGALGAIAE